MFKNILFIITVFATFLLNVFPVNSETLDQRITQYPHWNHQLSLPTPTKELIFPSWFEGRWNVTSTLKEQIAPLSPKFKTPGFDINTEYIDKDIDFQVQFIPTIITPKNNNFIPTIINQKEVIIPDRYFNGFSIAKAYLGDENVENVLINKHNSTEQITKFRGDNQLVSTVIGRQQETVSEQDFISSEITRQFFRRPNSIYLNLVETTTKYHLVNENYIQGKQVTAIYLSPKDPDYFLALNKPVALYYYNLNLHKIINY
ncbi:DUF6816 family protein [Geminocystis sp. GBBB08]|uniref:DUF6816 family protein n=1 Tax=Geminocystis sp. GBBB08 TaxID=2604140 RepID=UPI0027E2C1C7|nr:hypothetical protein [Geminocystis sp. GBBB08]